MFFFLNLGFKFVYFNILSLLGQINENLKEESSPNIQSNTTPSSGNPITLPTGQQNGSGNIYAKAQEALRAHYQHMGLIMIRFKIQIEIIYRGQHIRSSTQKQTPV